MVERERAAPNVIERAARRRNDDVDAAAERAELLLNRLTAIHWKHGGAEALPVLVDRLRDLHGELARRHEHEPAHSGTLAIATITDALQERQSKGGGLPGSSRRLTEDVAPREQRRNGLSLNGSRLLVPERGQRGDERIGEAEGSERRRRGRALWSGHGEASEVPDARRGRRQIAVEEDEFMAQLASRLPDRLPDVVARSCPPKPLDVR